MKTKFNITHSIFLLLLITSCVSQKKNVQNSRKVQNIESLISETGNEQDFLIENDSLIDESEFEEIEVVKESTNPKINYYHVQKNDTLMLVSFKLYGDYRRWKEIYKNNKETIPSDLDLSHVKSLYFLPISKTLFLPEGKPYLIKKGDSLSLISGKVYGDWNRWQEIWKNNETQIKKPNLIFAGFTLFYPSKDGRNTLAQGDLY